jgi:hypothetical protein
MLVSAVVLRNPGTATTGSTVGDSLHCRRALQFPVDTSERRRAHQLSYSDMRFTSVTPISDDYSMIE